MMIIIYFFFLTLELNQISLFQETQNLCTALLHLRPFQNLMVTSV